jgi:hypothetical protein
MERRNQQSGSPKARQSFKADRGHLLSVLLLTVCVVLPASAADRGFYAGINVGSSMFDSDHTIVSGKIITTTVTRTWTDDSSLAWSADVGYQLNRYIGIEASYWDLGSAAYDQTSTEDAFGNQTISHLVANISVTGPVLGVRGSLPLGKWELNGRLSALFASVDTSGPLDITRITVGPGGQTIHTSSWFSESNHFTSPFFGAGVSYHAGEHFVVSADWILTRDFSDSGQDRFEVTILTLGLHYRF